MKKVDIYVENGIDSLEFEKDKVTDKKKIADAVKKAGFTPDSITFLAKLPQNKNKR